MSGYELRPVKQKKRAMRTKVMLTAFYLQTFIVSEALWVEYSVTQPSWIPNWYILAKLFLRIICRALWLQNSTSSSWVMLREKKMVILYLYLIYFGKIFSLSKKFSLTVFVCQYFKGVFLPSLVLILSDKKFDFNLTFVAFYIISFCPYCF